MLGSTWVRIGASSGALAVILGAFLAHGLKPSAEEIAKLSSLEKTALDHRLDVFDTGAKYQMYHGLAMIGVGAVGMASGTRCSKLLNASGWLFLVGTIIFSGTLYGIGLGGPRWLGAITPFGGLAMIFGWLTLATGAISNRGIDSKTLNS